MIVPPVSPITGDERANGKPAPTAAGADNVARAATADAAVPAAEFLNRELSWLEFNRRVLHEAKDARNPLLERVKFLEIFTSNLDEFFMKRVGGLRRQIAAGVVSQTADGLTPQQQLAAIRKAVLPMLAEQADIFKRQVRPALTENGIHLLEWEQLPEAGRQAARRFFRANIFPVLTPLAVDPGHPFPFISNLSDSLGVVLMQPGRSEQMFARVKVPETLPRWVRVGSGETDGQFRFVRLVDIIRNNLQDLFANMTILDVMPFRLTRNADVKNDDEDAEDLLELVESELRQRRFARAVRLEHGANPNPWIIQFLKQELGLTADDVYESPGELDYGDLRPISDLNLPKLRFEPWTPVIPPALADDDADIFGIIRGGDLLVHHPYESFNASVERFIKAAAEDPKVLAIKMTVYRTGDDSPFIHTLIRAAEARKQVVCLVELKARFDEERNIVLAQALENAGVHVVYGIVGLKTHTKLALVVRQDPDGIRCYCHVGTGNYNAQTAKLYTDLGLFTCDPAITEEVVELFHYLTGRSLKGDYKKLLVAPVNMKDRFRAMIAREVAHHQAGRPARIVAKMNSLEDSDICRDLYAASREGLPIDLIVRGFCALRPGVPGMSENIRVISVIGRFLEHSRIFYFRNGASDAIDGEFYIGSADWMYRNLLARVEAVVPIEQRNLRERLWMILQTMQHDRRQAWDMRPDGSYVQREAAEGELGTHGILMALHREPTAAAAISQGR
ncbi:MAG TPA: polyphosphate kinase 1 [Humisphaera sp.]|jgi:polyphosphate kinase|nr:polyphosphate kinase 1 [Humisphaera sp.]